MNYSSASLKMKRGATSRGGSGRGRVKTPSSAGNQPSLGLEGLYSNERLVNAFTSVLGCTAKVTGKNGKQFEGVFKTISPEASLVLGKANQVEEQVQNGVADAVLPKPEMFEQFVMHKKDWVRVEFKNVNLEDCCFRKEFKTDVAIGCNKRMNGQRGKELEKWEPGDFVDSLETTGLEERHSMENGWSAEKMFEKNEKTYGVTSTYDETMEEYTTKLEKLDTPEYRERERIAEQKAKEITKESLYERSTIDSGRSEEQLYSAVVQSRSSVSNWRQPNNDRPPEREQGTARLSQQGFGSHASVRKEPVRSQQNDEPTKVQVKEKIEKPAVETPVECKPDKKFEAFNEAGKAEPKSIQNISQAKPLVTPTNTSVAPPTSTQKCPEPPDPNSTPNVTTPKTKSKDMKDIEELEELKVFSVNFKLPDEEKKTPKVKKVSEGEEKTSNEATKKEEKGEEVQTSGEVKADSESNDQKAKSALNPNAIEFRPRPKRNTPSPRSSSTASSSGTPSPFHGNPPLPVYPPNNIYSRNGPRGRGMRQEYIEPTAGYINASNAAGQPFFAHHMPHQFMHQPSPPGMPYIASGSIRHPGIQHQVFIQHQGPMMLPVGPMPPGHFPADMFYGTGHPMPTMIQSPPQITSPSLQQSQFNFPPPAIAQPINQVRPVSQPPAVIPQQPSPPVLYMRSTNEIQPTQIMTPNRPPPQSFQGN